MQILFGGKYTELLGASQVVLVEKNTLPNAGVLRDSGLIPESGRSPGGGHGNPLQYSCLENLMVRGAWWATVYKVTKNQSRLKWLSFKQRELPVGTTDSHWGAQGENLIEWGQGNYTESLEHKAETFRIHHGGNGKTQKALVQEKNHGKGHWCVDAEPDDLELKRIWGATKAVCWGGWKKL